ncbi:MAG: NAD(P)-binding protein, partial [Pseudomonadota bacterium]
TKTLEYMAAERPIVSTLITDVVDLYGEVVALAANAPAFIRACELALMEPVASQAQKYEKMRIMVAATSWQSTADKMHALLQSSLQQSASAQSAPDEWFIPQQVSKLNIHAPIKDIACIIIGAGPTGLSAAYHLDENTLLLEKNASVGGWCRSVEDHGFTFDYAGHIMFSNDAYVHDLYDILLGDNVHWQDREAWVFSKGVHTRYPFQGALYGLPPKVITECILGAIEASNGSSGANSKNPHKTENCVAKVSDCCADGSLTIPSSKGVLLEKPANRENTPQNFEEFIYKVWGRGIAQHFAIPYNQKLWTVPLTEMETSWLGGRVPLPDLEQIIEGALEPVAKPMGPNARFGYPLRGGFQAMMSGFLPHIKGSIQTSANVVSLSPTQRMVTLADGQRYRYDQLISTMPLPELIRLIGADAPEAQRKAAQNLRHLSVRCVNLGIGRENITEKHWIYYPEDTIFHRIFVQGNASPHCNPPGGFGLTCEISYSPFKPLPLDGQALIDRCMADCIRVGLLRHDDRLITANQVDMPYAYVIYDHARASNVALLRSWLLEHDIVLAGRYSEWEYYNSDHAFLAGKKAADSVLAMRENTAAASLNLS